MIKVSYYIIEIHNGVENRVYTGYYRNDTLEDLRSKLVYYRAEYPDNKFHIEKETSVITTEKLEF